MSCRDAHHVLSVTIPTCRGFHNRLSIFVRFFPRPYDPTTFVTDPRVRVGSSGTPALDLLIGRHLIFFLPKNLFPEISLDFN